MTITRNDIEQHVIRPALAGQFDEVAVSAITDQVLMVAPLSTWRYCDLQFTSEWLDPEMFWHIVQHVAQSDDAE